MTKYEKAASFLSLLSNRNEVINLLEANEQKLILKHMGKIKTSGQVSEVIKDFKDYIFKKGPLSIKIAFFKESQEDVFMFRDDYTEKDWANELVKLPSKKAIGLFINLESAKQRRIFEIWLGVLSKPYNQFKDYMNAHPPVSIGWLNFLLSLMPIELEDALREEKNINNQDLSLILKQLNERRYSVESMFSISPRQVNSFFLQTGFPLETCCSALYAEELKVKNYVLSSLNKDDSEKLKILIDGSPPISLKEIHLAQKELVKQFLLWIPDEGMLSYNGGVL